MTHAILDKTMIPGGYRRHAGMDNVDDERLDSPPSLARVSSGLGAVQSCNQGTSWDVHDIPPIKGGIQFDIPLLIQCLDPLDPYSNTLGVTSPEMAQSRGSGIADLALRDS